MTIGFLFWFVMFLCLLTLLGWGYFLRDPAPGYQRFGPYGGGWLFWFLLLLLGIKTFGWPISG